MRIKNRSRLGMTIIIICLFIIPTSAQDRADHLNCFSILVGKQASATGAVLMAHNEDDWGDQVVYIHKVPHQQHSDSAYYSLKNGGRITQPAETNAYLWLEIPNTDFGDAYLNEYGVAIASNACPSRCTAAELTDGGIDYDLRRIIAERAQSARQAVKLAGQLIEQFGYNSSGRTYSIADPQEAYLLAVVFGRYWLAQRIPDDAIALIPNYYTIGSIDWSDTVQFLAAPGLKQFAIDQGWYNPSGDQPFNFRRTFSAPAELTNIRNCARHWRAINFFSSQPYELNDALPTYIIPKRKVSREDLFEVLRLHYEGTHLELPGNPHYQDIMTICSEANQYGFVAELRSWLPPAVGAVLWLAPRRPCVMPFIPLPVGVSRLPSSFAPFDYHTAYRLHFQPPIDLYTFKPELFYWQCWQYTRSIDDNWQSRYPAAQRRRDQYQSEISAAHENFEKKYLAHPRVSPEIMTNSINEHLAALLQIFNKFLKR